MTSIYQVTECLFNTNKMMSELNFTDNHLFNLFFMSNEHKMFIQLNPNLLTLHNIFWKWLAHKKSQYSNMKFIHMKNKQTNKQTINM